MKARTVLVEREVTVLALFEVEVEPPEKGTPRTMGDPGTPDWPASASVLAVTVGGVQVPLDCIEGADLGRIEDDAIEEYEAADMAAYEAAMESRADAARERRLLGED